MNTPVLFVKLNWRGCTALLIELGVIKAKLLLARSMFGRQVSC